jgi:hypothetical protein
MKERKLLRADIARGINKDKGVDRNLKHDKGKGVIFGYAVIAKGRLNDGDIREWEMDDISLDQVVEFGNQAKMGLKSRFGHPNMSTEALGTFIGRAKNFRKDGDIVRADLFIDETAYKTPNGDLATYVMDLAETDPDAFGSSLVFDANFEYRLEKDGTRKKDEAGNDLPALVRFTKLFASDVVDDPATTKGMFGQFFNSSIELSAKATDFLDKLLNNPDALEKVISFLNRYRDNQIEGPIRDPNNNKPAIIQKEGSMEFKDITLEMLGKERKDLVESITNDAIKGERTRVLSIIKAEHTEFPGMKMEALTEETVEKGNTLDAALSSMRAKRLKDLEAEANKAPGADGDFNKTAKTHLEKATEYAKEHKCSMTEALRATAEKKVKK